MNDVQGCTNSEQSLAWAKQKLRNCCNEHELCQLPEITPLPSRVLDVGTPKSEDEIRFVRLLNTRETFGNYVCLSHCWGGHSTIKTTKETLEKHTGGIPISSLPKTFCDAVIFTHRLGLRYLWIDSLCIVQDDKDDWLRESQNMAGIYSNCYVCLAATVSENSHDGLFRDQSLIIETFASSDGRREDGTEPWKGLAQFFGKFRKGRYWHGIWDDFIHQDLGWSTWNPGGIHAIKRSSRGGVPTWSWAAVTAKILHMPYIASRTETHCEIPTQWPAKPEETLLTQTLQIVGLTTEGKVEYEGNENFVTFTHPAIQATPIFSNDYYSFGSAVD
ncbi:hypothetical protein HJFPF1_09492 [Paramyrothecium foliicola]|nr:hypothetical protein HJFPF1_09492 [Paramyrothecium foliicola]